jgi:hypothetical protein
VLLLVSFCTSFIREVHHPRWLANPVVVPKAGGKLRMCIDYTNLNKACPKDPFPLPRIDQNMDSTSGCDLLCFQDAYSGFHQIPMSKEDEEHTAFITVDGLFCYVSMPYGLRNALPTFVRAMHKTLGDLVRDLVEVYVNDIVVKVKSRASLLDNLALVFDRLRLTRTKLNPDKCVFGVTASKLLGFLVSYRGIEANPEKIKTIEAMRPPARIKEVQKLTGCLAALSRFISRLAEQALPFFKLLRKSGPFVWTDDAEEAFQELKRYLTSPPIMVAPEPGEPQLLYIAATAEAVSMVLVAERPDPLATHEHGSSSASGSGSRDPRPVEKPEARQTVGSQLPEVIPAHGDTGSQPPETASGPHDKAVTGARTSEVPLDPVDRELPEPEPMELDAPNTPPPRRVRTVQRPVYYISEVLHEAKTRYLEVNKLLYAVLIASRKLCHYFQAHKISVVSSFPLRVVLHNPNAAGNIAKWAAELVEFELDFVPRHAVKS